MLTRLVPALYPMLAAGSLAMLMYEPAAAQAGPTPEQKCQAGKNIAAGKLAACLQTAEAKLTTTGDAAKYAKTKLDCSYKFATRWLKLESAAARVGATCPDTPFDRSALEGAIQQCSANVASALAGAGLTECTAELAMCVGDLDTCTSDLGTCNGAVTTLSGNLSICNGSLTTCNANLGTCATALTQAMSDLGTCNSTLATLNGDLTACADSLTTASGSLDTCNGHLNTCNGSLGTCTANLDTCTANLAMCHGVCGSSGTFVDNCDGTITDTATGLMWEKKTTTVGSGQNFADPHDVDNLYTWTASGTPYPRTGTAFTDFLSKLNTPPCFAGHCDWRLPSEASLNSPFTGAKELQRILLEPYPCGTEPCIDAIFGPTATDGAYWSDTTSTDLGDGSGDLCYLVCAWDVNFQVGYTSRYSKNNFRHVRAVRTAGCQG